MSLPKYFTRPDGSKVETSTTRTLPEDERRHKKPFAECCLSYDGSVAYTYRWRSEGRMEDLKRARSFFDAISAEEEKYGRHP